MFKKIKGNIFNSSAQVLVNTVNCVGVMGRGIALECKLRFPEMYKNYKKFCDQKKNSTWYFTNLERFKSLDIKLSNKIRLAGSFKI